MGNSKIVIAESTAIGQSVLHAISLLVRRTIEGDTQLYGWEKDLRLAIVEMERANARTAETLGKTCQATPIDHQRNLISASKHRKNKGQRNQKVALTSILFSSPAWARTIAKNVGKTMRDQLGGPTRGPIAVKSRRHRLRVATSDRALVVTFRRDSKSSREFD